MLVKTYGSGLHDILARTVMVEVDISPGINFFMAGLPDSAVKESQHRIESALKSNGLEILKKRTVMNMAPADILKEGSAYDLPMAINARKEGFKGIILPEPSAEEAAVISGLDVFCMKNNLQVVALLSDRDHLSPVMLNPERIFKQKVDHFALDFSEVKGQARVKRALEIAASGSHNLLML